ncbi:MAG: hypothetical protein AB7T74_09325 [Clostridia bacterium]
MNKNRFLMTLFASAMVALALSGLSCASTPQDSAVPPATAPAEKAAAKDSGDYLADTIKLAGIRLFDWQGDLYTVPFYTAEILTPASEATKNEALVQPTGKVDDSAETRFWTRYVASSRPATKDDLQPGTLVFAMGDAAPRSREDLARNTKWGLFRVKDTGNLYKGTVTVEYFDTYWNTWKDREYHLDNLRLVLGDFSPEL